MWHHRGTPHYLKQQGIRLRLPVTTCDRAKHNQEIYKVSSCLGQICERYHRARAGTDTPRFGFAEQNEIVAALALQEVEVDKLHALAAAAGAMMAEAYKAIGVARPARRFAVVSDFDSDPDSDSDNSHEALLKVD